MTYKRFNVFDVDGTIFLEDHEEGSYHIGEIGNVDVNCLNDIADRLNDLNDENKKLKQVNEMLQIDFAMTERNLIEENEQLKKEILWWKYRCGEDISGDVE